MAGLVVVALTLPTAFISGAAYAAPAPGPAAPALASTVAADPVAPDAPVLFSAVGGDSSIKLSFTVPADGGSEITGYQAFVDGDDLEPWHDLVPGPDGTTGRLKATVTGLDNGTTYQHVKVRALNAEGAGAESAEFTATPAAAPGVPLLTGVADSNASSVVTFSPPSSDGGSPITEYQYSLNRSATWQRLRLAAPGSSLTATVTGLTNGVVYGLRIRAVNASGRSAASASMDLAPHVIAPAAPSAVVVTAQAGGAEVVFTPGSGGGETPVYWATTDSGATWIATSAPTNAAGGRLRTTLSGLSNGTAYTLRLVARNSVGDSPLSAASGSFTPITTPSAPTVVSASDNGTSADVVFTPASDGGSAVTGWQVSTDGGTSFSAVTTTPAGSDLSATVTGLTPGTTYQVEVRALNVAGAGAASAASPVSIDAVAPSAPSVVSVTDDGTSADVLFTPAFDGGSPVTGWQVSTDGGTSFSTVPTTASGDDVAATVSGLTPGSTYQVQVRALNAVGTGAQSASSPVTIDAVAPSAPSVVASANGTSADLVITPDFDGGSPVTGWEVSTDDGDTWVPAITGTNGSDVTATVTNLQPGSSYDVRARAVNAVGTGVASAASQVLIAAVAPSAPTALVVVPGDAVATVSFLPAFNGGSPVLRWESSTDGTTWTTVNTSPVGGSRREGTVTGLVNEQAATLHVRAVNNVGDGAASVASASFTPDAAPGAPTNVSATDDGTSIDVVFTPSSTGLTTVLRYELSTDDGANFSTVTTTVSGSDLAATVTGLIPGQTYDVRVRAVNTTGTGVASSASTVTIDPVAPEAPTVVSATPTGSSVHVVFTPGFDGGAPVSWEVSSDSGATWTTPTATPADGDDLQLTVPGLVPGQTYALQLRAVNTGGPSSSVTAPSVTIDAVAPSAPTIVTVDDDGTSVDVVFTPGFDGGSAVTAWQVSTDDGATFSTVTATVSGNDLSATVTGLTPGQTYDVKVRAVNTTGTGAQSASSTVTIDAVAPSAPTVVSATADGSSVDVVFTPGFDGGDAVDDWEVSSDGGLVWLMPTVTSAGGDDLQLTVPGLTPGETYAFQLRGVNGEGSGAVVTAPSVTIGAVAPSAPSVLSAIATGTSVDVEFAPGFDGGSAVTGWEISTDGGTDYAPATTTVSGGHLATSVTGLTPGQAYDVQVRAVNAVGTGAASPASHVTVAAVAPSAPTVVSATATGTSVDVVFTPAFDGGSAVTAWQVSTDGGASFGTVTTGTDGSDLTASVSGLVPGSTYSVEVRAVNAVGTGAASAASSVTVDAVAPSAPTGLTASPVRNGADLVFAQAFDGGSPVTRYEVSTNGTTWSTLVTTADLDGVHRTAAVTGLRNGATSTVYVRAVNVVAAGSATSTTVSLAPSEADAPAVVSVTRKNMSADLVFTPGYDGGSAVTSYEFSTDGFDTVMTLATTAVGPNLKATITGLENGTVYTVQVRAVNALGTSPASAPSASFMPATTPTAPTLLDITPGNGSATVTFQSPASDGGSVVQTYQYQLDGGIWQSVSTTGGNLGTRRAVITGLTNDVAYTVRVRASNAVGAGSASAIGNVTPVPVAPAAPTGLVAAGSNGSAALTFTAPSTDGGSPLQSYEVSRNGGTWTALATTTSGGVVSASLTGLTNGTAYTFAVRAVSERGGPSASSGTVSVTPMPIVPTVPALLSATPGNASAVLVFTAPASDGGSAVLGYEASTDGSTWVPLTGITGTGTMTATLGGLTNGTTYSVQVRAVNGVGHGAPSSAASVTPVTVPGAPQDLHATEGDGTARLSFLPGSDGGTAITLYEVTTDGSTWAPVTVGLVQGRLDGTVSGLTNGTEYTVRVRATNAVGTSPASGSALVTPATTPSAPTITSVVRGDAGATVTFQPGFNGGKNTNRWEASVDGGQTFEIVQAEQVGGGLFAFPLTGLVNGTAYTVVMTAHNTFGYSPSSAPSSSFTPATTPSAPAALDVEPGNGSATLTILPGATGGSAITGYQSSIDAGEHWDTLVTRPGSGNALTASLSGLVNGESYTVWVRALNELGAGSHVASAAVVPATTPSLPTDLTVQRGEGEVHLRFAPGSDGGRPALRYEVSVSGGTWTTITTEPAGDGRLEATVEGLANGTTYTLRVRSVNVLGAGAASEDSAQVTPATRPSAPDLLSVELTDGTATVSFQPGFNGGTAVTAYQVQLDDAEYVTVDTAPVLGGRTLVLPGLLPGSSHTVHVRALNDVGTGVESAPLTVDVPAVAPALPTALAVETVGSSASVSFLPGDGGGAEVGYLAVLDGGEPFTPVLSAGDDGRLSFTLAELAPGSTHAVQVAAVSTAGTSGYTAVSEFTVSAVAAQAPTQVSVVPGDGEATVTFLPGSDGGSTVLGYQALLDDGEWSDVDTTAVDGGLLQATLHDLANGRTYALRLRALTVFGEGTGSAAQDVVLPALAPDAPQDLQAQVGNGTADVSFLPGDDGGSEITGYQVSVDEGDFLPVETTGDDEGRRTAHLDGLANGTSYSVRFRAVNPAGTGTESEALEVTPVADVPSAPTVTATAEGTTIMLSVTPVDDGGGTVQRYEYALDGGAWTTLVLSGDTEILTGHLDGLARGRSYDVSVRAVNESGPGEGSDPQTVEIAAVAPSAPSDLRATSGDASATLTFTRSASDGGRPVSYQYALGGGSWTALSTTGTGERLTAVLHGLQNGSTYDVTVRATNAAGSSAATAPVRVAPLAVTPVTTKYAALGGAQGVLGAVVGDVVALPGNGLVQRYANGRIYYTPATGAWSVRGAVLERYLKLGGNTGVLGLPTTDQNVTPDGVGRYNHFSGTGGASIYWTPTTGAHAVQGAIRKAYADLGWERTLGYPTSDELATADKAGRYNTFTRGAIYWSARSGAHAVQGAILERYLALGGPTGTLGYPLSNELAAGAARYSEFTNGSVYWTNRTGAWAVQGLIRGKWLSLGGLTGRLGAPVTNEYAVTGGRRSDFLGGSVTWSSRTGLITVTYK